MATITEALAEIKTISKRITKKHEFIVGYLARQEGLKDPLEKDGGSVEVIRRERQAVADLETRIVALRRGIQRANDRTTVTVNGVTRSISDWLTWRRDVSGQHRSFLHSLQQRLSTIREQVRRSGSSVIAGAAAVVHQDAKATDVVININEGELAQEIETLEETLGQLDGQLSLKNATVMIEE